MAHEFDVYPYLVNTSDMEEFEDEAELAADQLNEMLHSAANQAQNRNWTEKQTIKLIEELCFVWFREPGLTELESDETDDYVFSVIRRMEQQSEDAESDIDSEYE